MGALFIAVNFTVNGWRKSCLKTKVSKVVETGIFALVSSSVFFLAPYVLSTFSDNCVSIYQEGDVHHDDHHRMLSAGNEELFDTWGTNSLYKAWCDEGYFDKTAGLYWAAEVEVIRNVIAWKVDVTIIDLLIFVSIWYLFTIITYGTNVPAGLFLPGIIIGCVLGKITFIFADNNDYLIYD